MASFFQKEFKNIRVSRWILILLISAIAIALAYWIPAEMNKPPPEIREGVIDGYFDGQVRYWDAYAVKSKGFNESCASRHGIGSYNQSWVHMWGSIKYNDGSIEDASIEGKEIRGALCILDVDNNIFASSTNKETPGVIYFRGEVREMPFVDLGWTPPWIVAGIFAGAFLWALNRRRQIKKFDINDAKRLFYKKLATEGHQENIFGIIQCDSSRSSGGKTFDCSVPLKIDGRKYDAVYTCDTSGSELTFRIDDTGEVYNAKMGVEGRKVSLEFEQRDRKYDKEDITNAIRRDRAMQKEREEKEKKPENQFKDIGDSQTYEDEE